MKKTLLSIFFIVFFISFVHAQIAVSGDYRSAGSGPWSATATWQIRDGLGNWSTSSTAPTSTNNVYIQAGHSVSVDVAAVCLDLHLNTAGVLAIGSNSVSVNGKLRADTLTTSNVAVNGAVDGAFYTQTSQTNLNSTLITATGNGVLKFVGLTRSITIGGEWGPSGCTKCPIEISLNANNTATLNTAIKFKHVTVSSGILDALTNKVGADSLSTGGSGNVTIKSGAKVISSRSNGDVFGALSTTRCGTVTIESGAILELTGKTPFIDCAAFVNNGTVAYNYTASSTPQTLLQPDPTLTAAGVLIGGIPILSYKNISISNSPKTIPLIQAGASNAVINISDTLTLGGATNNAVFTLANGTLTYGTNGTLVMAINGTNTNIFVTSTSIEWPLTSGPKNVAVNSNYLVLNGGAGFSRTIAGTLSLLNTAVGGLNVNAGCTLIMANNSTIFRNNTNSKLTLVGSGILSTGAAAGDSINIIIGATMSTDNEFLSAPTPGGYKSLNILTGTYTYSTSGSRTVTNLTNNGVFVILASANLTINGDVSGTGTISGTTTSILTLQGPNASAITSAISFTTGAQFLKDLIINRTGLGAIVKLGTSVSVDRNLAISAGTLADMGNVITVGGNLSGAGIHTSTSVGKIMMTGTNLTQSRSIISTSALTFGNLEINPGVSGTIIANASFIVANNFTLTSGIFNTNNSSVATVYNNVYGNATFNGSGRIKMTGSNKTISGINVTILEVLSAATITATDTLKINSALIISSGIFNDGGNIITVAGNIQGPGIHVSTGNGKIKMISVSKTISVAGISFGNLEIAPALSTSVITASTSFTVNDLLTLTSGILADGGNTITAATDILGTGTHTGSGRIRMIGANNSISGVTIDSLEISTASNITATGAFTIKKGLIFNGNLADGGFAIKDSGIIRGAGIHTGIGKIVMTGIAMKILGRPTINNLEVAAPNASISTGCDAIITGTLLMNGGNVTIDSLPNGTRNLLTFKNNSSIIRNSGNLNLNTGTVQIGTAPSDLITVFINNNLQSTNELPGTHIGDIDLTIGDGFSYTLKSNSKSVRNLNISNGHLLCLFDTLSRGPYNLTVSGLATVSGDFSLDSSQYSFVENGNTVGPFMVGPSLIINNSGKFKFGNVNNKTFNSNGLLVLKSRKSGTASVGDVTNGGANNNNKIIGVASVERYVSNMKYLIGDSVPTVKAWRLLAMPTKHDYQTIKQAWQEGGSLNSDVNPGYGIQLVGYGPASQLSNAIANGFDTISAAGASIKKWDPALGTGAWVPVASTNALFETGQAYMVFIRGSRAKTLFNQTPDTTVLRERGTLNVGDTTVAIGTAGGQFVAVANPYPSTINFSLLDKTNLAPYFYFYDPRLQNIGGYQTVDIFGNITPGGGSYGAVSNITSSYIQSSQGFFVRTTSAAGTIGFKETAKVDGSSMTSRVTLANPGMLRTTLFKLQNGNYDLSDGVLHIFDSSYSKSINDMDAVKMNNLGENLGIKLADKTLAVESRPFLLATDTIFYNLGQMKIASYKFSFTTSNLLQNGLQAFLEDRYLNNSTAISLIGTTDVYFTISNVAGSYASDRFRMVFRQLAPLPVTFIDVKAALQNKSVKINWVVANQLNIKEYKVERSVNGVDFQHIGTTVSTANTLQTSYDFFDDNPVIGTNFYRIRSIENDGSGKLSKVVKVAIQNAAPQFVISPNPVGENREIHLKVNELPAGDYTGNLYDYAGKKIESKKWHHEAGEAEIVWKVSSSLPNGNYNLCISNKEMKICESVLIK